MKMIEFSIKDSIAYICSASQTTMKLWMSTSPFLKVDWSKLSVQEKYETLQQAFEGSKKDLPMPDNPNEFSKSILAAFGLKSWKALYEGGRHCSIELDTDKNQYCLTPMVYLRQNKSLYGIKAGIEYIPASASPEDMIATLEGILEKLPRLEEEYYEKERKTEDPLI